MTIQEVRGIVDVNGVEVQGVQYDSETGTVTTPPISALRDPIATDEAPVTAQWLNTETGILFTCVVSSATDAVWRQTTNVVLTEIPATAICLVSGRDGLVGNHVFTDLTDSAQVMQTEGVPTYSDVNPKFGTHCIDLTASGSSLYFLPNNFELRANDWTLEFWAYIPTATGTGVVWGVGAYSNVSGGQRRWYNGTNMERMEQWPLGVSSGYTTLQTTAPAFPADTWVHLCIEKHGDNHNTYYDGVRVMQNVLANFDFNGTAQTDFIMLAGHYLQGSHLAMFAEDLMFHGEAIHLGANFTPRDNFVGM